MKLASDQELAEILALPATQKRARLRGLLNDFRNRTGTPSDTAIKEALTTSSIIGTESGQHNIRPCYSGLRDALSMPVLIALCAEPGLNWAHVLFAIKHPEGSTLDSNTSSGYALGRPLWLTDGYMNKLIVEINRSATKNKADAHMSTTDPSIDVLVDTADALIAADFKSEVNRVENEGLSYDRDGLLDSITDETIKKMVHRKIMSESKADALRKVFSLRSSDGATPNYDTYEPSAHEAVTNLIAKFNGTAPAPTPAAPSEEPGSEFEVTIDAAHEALLNMALKTATGGKIDEFGKLLTKARTYAAGVAERDKTIATLRQQMAEATAKAALSATSLTGTSELPAGKMVMRKGNDLGFGKSALLNFDVPTFEWDGPHPYVPTVDPDYVFKPGIVAKFLTAVAKGYNVWLVGMPGTGKTEFLRQAAARMGWPVVRVNFDSEITRMDMIGREVLRRDGGTTVSEFVEGVLPMAMKMPCFFLADEIDYIRPDIAYVFQRVLEGDDLLLTEDGGRTIRPNPFFRIVATANTKGAGDDLGLFPGVRTQSNAFRDRFQTWIEFDYLKKEHEQQLLLRKFPDLPEAVAEQFISLATEVRNGFRNGEVYETISPRTLFSMAATFTSFKSILKPAEAIAVAMESAIYGRCGKQDSAKIREYAARVMK